MGNNVKLMPKLAAILVAPVVLLLVLAFVGVRSRQAEAEEAQRVLALTQLAGAATSLLSKVEGEALQAARYSGSEGSPENQALFEQRQQATIAAAEEVERMLQDLPEREAEVVRLYHLSYLNYRQISKQLGIPENSVGPILARARQKLRQVAEQRAGG